VSIIGLENLQTSATPDPAPTSIDVSIGRTCMTAITLPDKRLRAPRRQPAVKLAGAELMERASVTFRP